MNLEIEKKDCKNKIFYFCTCIVLLSSMDLHPLFILESPDTFPLNFPCFVKKLERAFTGNLTCCFELARTTRGHERGRGGGIEIGGTERGPLGPGPLMVRREIEIRVNSLVHASTSPKSVQVAAAMAAAPYPRRISGMGVLSMAPRLSSPTPLVLRFALRIPR